MLFRVLRYNYYMEFPAGCKVIDSPDLMTDYERDESWLKGRATCVLIPEDQTAVGNALRWANDRDLPLVIRGGGTGMVGGALPDQAAVLSLEKLRIIRVDRTSQWVYAQAGAFTADVDRAAARHQLWYPVDPGSLDSCTIGGNFATNAGGPRAFRFGVTSRWVLKVSGFLADGTPVSFGSLACKDVAGYGLRDLMCGSEGTLTVITDLWLRLIGRPPALGAVLLFVPVEQAPPLMSAALRHWPQFTAVEYFDPLCAALLAQQVGVVLADNQQAAFLLEQAGSLDEITIQLAAFAEQHAADAVSVAGLDVASHQRIWEARRGMSKAMFRFGEYKYNEDIGLPAAAFTLFFETIRHLEQEYNMQIPVFGHVGDGNLHVNVMHSESQRQQAQQIVGKVFDRVLELEGTISGEHGIGLTKKSWLEKQVGQVELNLMRGVRKVFDPAGRLGKGKVFDE